jgi:kynurenine formamidase
MKRLAICAALLAAFGCISVHVEEVAPAKAAPARALVDLTHAFDAETVYWPTEEGFVLERGSAGVTQAGYYYEAHRFRAAEHGGTHLDAPIHFAKGQATADEVPLERLFASAVVVDVSAACARDPDYAVSVADLEAFEAAQGRIPEGSIVLLRTGWGRYWPDRARYLGTAERGSAAVAKLHFPGLGAEAARWLAAERRIGAVGIDTASIDPGVSRTFEAHRALFERDVPAIENLAQLELLPPRGFEVAALPMKIAGGSGAPLRAVAIVPVGRD